MRLGNTVVIFAACLPLLAGCAGLAVRKSDAPQGGAALPEGADLVTRHLETVERLGSASAVEQVAMTEAARIDFVAVPTPSNRLRYAMVLATPGHAGFDPATAQEVLQTLLSAPEVLSDTEQALAAFVNRELATVLSLRAQLQERDAAAAAIRDQLAAANQRSLSLTAENARLSEELGKATRKLEAVAELEKSLSTRRVTPEEKR
jgi:hypothetical protein